MMSKVSAALRLVASILLEAGKVEDLVSKWKGIHPDLASDIDKVAAADPSGTGKYLLWQFRHLAKGEEADVLVNVVDSFHKNIQRISNKDVNSYSLDTLQKTLEALGDESKTQEKKGKIKEIKKDAEYLYDDGEYLLVHPKSMKASCHYGRGTKWCISATESKNYFDDYAGRNCKFYFLIDRSQDGTQYSKVAIVLKPNVPSYFEAFDTFDERIPLSQFEHDTDSAQYKAVQIAREHVRTQPDNWQFVLSEALEGDDLGAIESLVNDHWSQLDDDFKFKVLRSLLDGPYSPPEELVLKLLKEMPVVLGNDRHSAVELAAQNKYTPASSLEYLFSLGMPELNRYLAWNPNTPDFVLQSLFDDTLKELENGHAGYATELAQNSKDKVPIEWLVQLFPKVKTTAIVNRLAQSRGLSEQVYAGLAMHGSTYVHRLLAQNPDLPANLQTYIYRARKGDAYGVVATLAEMAKEKELLQEIIDDADDAFILSYMMRNSTLADPKLYADWIIQKQPKGAAGIQVPAVIRLLQSMGPEAVGPVVIDYMLQNENISEAWKAKNKDKGTLGW
jgi:hypothetical protein